MKTPSFVSVERRVLVDTFRTLQIVGEVVTLEAQGFFVKDTHYYRLEMLSYLVLFILVVTCWSSSHENKLKYININGKLKIEPFQFRKHFRENSYCFITEVSLNTNHNENIITRYRVPRSRGVSFLNIYGHNAESGELNYFIILVVVTGNVLTYYYEPRYVQACVPRTNIQKIVGYNPIPIIEYSLSKMNSEWPLKDVCIHVCIDAIYLHYHICQGKNSNSKVSKFELEYYIRGIQSITDDLKIRSICQDKEKGIGSRMTNYQ
ncbi:hypothetical protein K501DRAFT_280463 [Backusella circina FSU 941]|nr:hypothetical protein K501DRAFT_280463 [Backusella circina FSU 941]